ncbi:dihydroorotase [Pseudarcicella hirudinis]|uniref:Dihydroorotase n=1 Tax=Pseudarcicella hirudinis TaxID=1079859 RepID=A0A1I5SGW2_9BACT|nr:dihydroorotase [Pseudarcicella hirudinis]SFP69970.1 dihydroorotase [Pseudarcicella hirudinis]
MKILIRSAKIVQKGSSLNGLIRDIFIENGKIAEIGENLMVEADEVVEEEGLSVSAGWFDMRVHAKDPGLEYKEDLYSMESAAKAGGITEIATLPNTKPTVQTRESVQYLKNFGKNNLVAIHPMAAVTLKCEGKDFTEMIDLNQAGAVAFTDGEHPLQNADIFLKTLQYLAQFGGILVNRPEEENLTHFGQMHEGITSTLIGMKGMPKMAEDMMVMRDLKLLQYVVSSPLFKMPNRKSLLHFSCISTAESVEMIGQAKEMGLPVSCDVAAHQLAFTDENLFSFDPNLKVNPPFRAQEDVDALWEGLANGTIDAIVSDHNPHEEESKKLEFDMAEFGVIGLETLFPAIATNNEILSAEEIIEKITTGPRRILGIANPKIEIGQNANLTVFSADKTWNYTEKSIVSKSKNSPFIGQTFTGKAVAVINNGKFWKTEK